APQRLRLIASIVGLGRDRMIILSPLPDRTSDRRATSCQKHFVYATIFSLVLMLSLVANATHKAEAKA
ncbi:MAG TPA: hypothetical protein V6D48_05470, partial [Oculatellaceae cyanobacterium]